MNIIVVVAAVVLAVTVIILIMVICCNRPGKKDHRSQYQNQSKNVLVKNGVDVKRQALGGEKGDYFTGNLKRQDTYLVNPAVRMWRVVFDDLNRGKRMYVDFVRQMCIGRGGSDQDMEAELTITWDGKVSRRHCMIYEGNGMLCLKDLHSRNHTYLNGQLVTDPVYLQNGDVIRIGDTQLKVQYGIINSWPT